MLADITLLPVYSIWGRMGRINGILVKLSIENFLGDFTQIGGISAPSAPFVVGVCHEPRGYSRHGLRRIFRNY